MKSAIELQKSGGFRTLPRKFINLNLNAKLVWFFCTILFFMATLGPVITINNAYDSVGDPFVGPSFKYIFGTDDAGRDLLPRIFLGLRYSLIGAFIVVTSGILIGGVVAVMASMGPKWLDSFLMRITDLFLALPAPLLAIALVSAIGASYKNTLLAIAIVWWPFYARVLRGKAIAIKSLPFVEAAKISGISSWRVATRHIAPGLKGTIIVLASLDIGGLVLTLAGLSFLGLGAPAPTPELGSMSAQGLPYLLTGWWIPVVPSLSIFAIALIANLIGDYFAEAYGVES